MVDNISFLRYVPSNLFVQNRFEVKYMLKLFPVKFIIIFLLVSCREDIIEPGNPAGNYNSPVIEKGVNHFSIVLNAISFSAFLNIPTDLMFENSQILLNLSDVSDGSVRLTLKDKNGGILYSTLNSSEVKNESKRLSNSIPETFEMRLNNFTGKLKFSVYNSP